MNLRRIGLINIGLLVIIVLGWFIFFYMPVSGEINSMNNEINDLENRITEIGRIEQNKAQIDRRLGELEQDLKRLFNSVESDRDIDNTVEYIEQLARLHNLELEYINPSPANQFGVSAERQKQYFDKSLHSYPVDIFLTGKFIETGKFLEDLTVNNEPVHVRAIHLLTDTQLPDKLHVEIKLLAYTAKD